MSKQSEAKKQQGYVSKHKPTYCMFCANYTSLVTEHKGPFVDWTEESNKRCGIGGFAIAKQGTCNAFKAKAE